MKLLAALSLGGSGTIIAILRGGVTGITTVHLRCPATAGTGIGAGIGTATGAGMRAMVAAGATEEGTTAGAAAGAASRTGALKTGALASTTSPRLPRG